MGKYKHGKQKRVMENPTFWNIIEHGYFVKPRMHRAFVTLLWYVGCRVTEIIELKKEQFEITKELVKIDIPAKKHGIERPPFQLNRKLPYINQLVEYVESRRGNKRKVFPFNRGTAWQIIKRCCGKPYYPHFFRLNRTVKFLNNPKITTNEVRQWMAWKELRTVENYLGYSERTIGKLSKTLD